MKTPFKHIQQQLRLNRLVVLTVVLVSGMVCVVSMVLVVSTHRQAMANAFMVSDQGAVLPLRWDHGREHLEVEALAHLEQFHRWFYDLDAGSFERNMERALWLGNASVDNLYRQKKSEGLYNRLLQYSLVQQVEAVQSEITLGKEAHEFRTRTVFHIIRGEVTDIYELITTGKLIAVERNFPYNPHGLLITDFFENSLRKIEANETTEK